jgi:hypothetical protein
MKTNFRNPILAVAILVLAVGSAWPQNQTPTRSFVFNLEGPQVDNSDAVKKMAGQNLTCSDIADFIAERKIQKENTAYLIHVYQAEADLSRSADNWYSYDSSWGTCKFSRKNAWRWAGRFTDDVHYAQLFKNQRLWGRTSVTMVAVISVPGTPASEVFKANSDKLTAVLTQLAAKADNSDALVKRLQRKSFCDNYGSAFDPPLPCPGTGLAADDPNSADESLRVAIGNLLMVGKIEAAKQQLWTRLVRFLASGQAADPITVSYREGGKVVQWKFTPDCKSDAGVHCALSPFDVAKMKIKYQWDVTKVTPDPVQNLETALSQGTASGAGQGLVGGNAIPLQLDVSKDPSASLVASRAQTINLVPSAVKATGTLTPDASMQGTDGTDKSQSADQPKNTDSSKSAGTSKNDVALGSATVDNEGRYWWNVSVALPLKAVKSLDYDTATLNPKTIDNKAAYAAFDLYLGKIDTKNSRFRLRPAFFGGPSFTGKFLDRWMVGVSIGAWFVEPFWGYSFLKSNLPNTGVPGTNVHWDRAPVWGINIPIRNFYKLTTNNSGKATSTNSKSTSAQGAGQQ